MEDDRRRYERVRIPLDARWEGLSGRHEARVYDLSLSGCYIESSGQVQVEERVRFEIQSPSGRWLSLQGKVRHFQPNFGFAVHFTEPSEAQMSSLAALLAYAQT